MAKVILAYIAVRAGNLTNGFLARFSATFERFPPGYPCEVIVCCNGGPLDEDCAPWIHDGWKCLPRENRGADLGAYFHVARDFDCDLLVCLGESLHFHRPDWLKTLVSAFEQYPGGMYGFFASNLVTRHLNTSAFAIDPKLLRSCPTPSNRMDRLKWEHGPYPFWKRVSDLWKPVKLVTFSGIFNPPEWRTTTAGMWQTDQSDCLAWSIHCDRFFKANQETRRRWEKNANCGLQK